MLLYIIRGIRLLRAHFITMVENDMHEASGDESCRSNSSENKLQRLSCVITIFEFEKMQEESGTYHLCRNFVTGGFGSYKCLYLGLSVLEMKFM